MILNRDGLPIRRQISLIREYVHERPDNRDRVSRLDDAVGYKEICSHDDETTISQKPEPQEAL